MASSEGRHMHAPSIQPPYGGHPLAARQTTALLLLLAAWRKGAFARSFMLFLHSAAQANPARAREGRVLEKAHRAADPLPTAHAAFRNEQFMVVMILWHYEDGMY